MTNDSCKTRGPLKGRSGCRAPQEGAASASRTKAPNEHSPYRMTNDSCKTRGPLKGRSGCRAPQEGAASASRTKAPNEHSPYRMTNDSCKTRGPLKGRSGCRAPQEGAASASRTKDQTSIRHSLLCVYASQDKRIAQHEPHLPVIGNAARLHANELRPFLILLPYYNSRQPGDDLLRAVCCFFRFTKLN